MRIINETPDALFGRFAAGAMTFRPLPPLEEEPRDERTEEFKREVDAARLTDPQYIAEMAALEQSEREDASDEAERIERALKDRVRAALGMKPRVTPETVSLADHARQHNIDPSYDLPSRMDGGDDKEIQLLLLPEMADRKLSGLLDLTTTHLQETGINTLFAAFGFLEWYEDDASDRKLHAPLILVPMHMTRELKKHRYVYSIAANGDGPEANITLREKLRKDFRIALPELEEEDTPESYWKKIEKAIAEQKRWRIKRWVSVGVLPFAKMVLYHDLDPAKWSDPAKLLHHGVVQDVLIGREREPGECKIYDVDHPSVEAVAPLLITEADSSQHSAVVDAMGDRSLVIKGPPGTGKSQTITNIIAAALGKGQKVLFIAEKMAALNVVSNRLDKAGLGPFCLELHSDKVRRADVAKSLKARLEYQSAGDPDGLDSKLTHLRMARAELNDYAALMNSPFGRTGLTVHDVFWAAQRAREHAAHLPTSLQKAKIKNVEEIDELTIGRAETILNSVEGAYEKAMTDRWTFADHPWRGVSRAPMTTFDANAIADDLRRFRDAMLGLHARLRICKDELGWAPADSREKIDAGLAAMLWIVEAGRGVRGAMLPALQDGSVREATRKFLQHQAALAQVTAFLNGTLGTSEIRPEDLRPVGERAVLVGDGAATPGEIAGALEACEKQIAAVERCLGLVRRLAAAFGQEGSVRVTDVAVLMRAVDQVARAPRATLAVRMRSLMDAGAREVLEKARIECARLLDEASQLDATWHMDRPVRAEDLDAHVAALREDGLFASFGKAHRAARTFAREFSRSGQKVKAGLAAQGLERVARHLRARAAFEGTKRLVELCGDHFDGLKTDFDRLIAACGWLEEVQGAFIEADQMVQGVRQALLQGDLAKLEAARQLAGDTEYATLNDLIRQLRRWDRQKIDEVDSNLRGRLGQLRWISERCRALSIQGAKARFEEFDKLADALAGKASLVQHLATSSVGYTVFGSAFCGAETDTRGAAEAVAFAERVMAEADFGPGAAALRVDLEAFLRSVSHQSVELRTAIEAADRILDEFSEAAALDRDAFFAGAELKSASLAQIIARCENALENVEGLTNWSALSDAIARAREAGLSSVIDAFIHDKRPLSRLHDAYLLIVYRAMVEMAYQLEGGLLKRHQGHSHEQVRARFRTLDKEILLLNRKRIAAQLAAARVPMGVSRGRKADWTDRALIENEANKQKMHIPIRALMTRAGKAVQALKPAFLMSPLSVAQYLDREAMDFDLVVIDEASQTRPEEAIGALVRGKRAVIVGDPMQLPPTSFFQRVADEPGDEELEDEKITNESILDMALQVYQPARDLRWHYRSRHVSLIAYSNKEFYGNGLITFPSPHEKHPSFGVHMRKVGGVYHAGANPIEAAAIVSGAIDHMHRHPDRSLGIVAMNQTQRELIHEEMERAIKSDDRAATYIAKWQETLEPFFVKNLESVQGDERSVIMISTVYGPDRASGKVMQRFGPITQATGHRRLNVLFTRAKEQTVLYTSMTPDQIHVDQGSSWGLRVLKGYMEYAATGHLESGVQTGRAPDSDFEIWVAEQLRLLGCEAVPQVGVAGFFIDIGVRHANWPHGFLFGIECDGATYHSGKSARDRDRLRQEVLEDLGWNIYRIWSSDFFTNPAAEMAKVKKHVEKRLEEKAAQLSAGRERSSLRVVK